jgi:selenocysteine lyase/cysteine desulfurase
VPQREAAKRGRPQKDIDMKSPAHLLHRYLERKRVICAPREGMLRFAPHFYNDELDLDRAVAALRRVL